VKDERKKEAFVTVTLIVRIVYLISLAKTGAASNSATYRYAQEQNQAVR
jgi:hypothetical protein